MEAINKSALPVFAGMDLFLKLIRHNREDRRGRRKVPNASRNENVEGDFNLFLLSPQSDPAPKYGKNDKL